MKLPSAADVKALAVAIIALSVLVFIFSLPGAMAHFFPRLTRALAGLFLVSICGAFGVYIVYSAILGIPNFYKDIRNGPLVRAKVRDIFTRGALRIFATNLVWLSACIIFAILLCVCKITHWLALPIFTCLLGSAGWNLGIEHEKINQQWQREKLGTIHPIPQPQRPSFNAARFFRDQSNTRALAGAVNMAERTQYAYDWWHAVKMGPQASASGILSSHGGGFMDPADLRSRMAGRYGKIIPAPPQWMALILCSSKQNADRLAGLPETGNLSPILKAGLVTEYSAAMSQPGYKDFNLALEISLQTQRQFLTEIGKHVSEDDIQNARQTGVAANSFADLIAGEEFPVLEFAEGVQANIVREATHMNDFQAKISGLRKINPELYAEFISGLYDFHALIPIDKWNIRFPDEGRTASALGLERAYAEAKHLGSAIAIPMGTFLSAALDKYRIALTDDIKFDCAALTQNEIRLRAAERQAILKTRPPSAG